MFIDMQDDLNNCVKSNKKVHDEYEINNKDINSNEKFRYRSLSECVVEDNYTLYFTMIKEPSADKQAKKFNFLNCFNIFKKSLLRIKEIFFKESSNNNESLSTVAL
ncbi:fam-c protein [Plasmodium vinckei petteri]|uniref:Fam-c protein n=1 Tax=Plasmodium vinckei petteri TaxID=138298 RepID=A0A6V7T432_PLAVN|nr:fam-c protein [Plasmodium vinckei petteri]